MASILSAVRNCSGCAWWRRQNVPSHWDGHLDCNRQRTPRGENLGSASSQGAAHQWRGRRHRNKAARLGVLPGTCTKNREGKTSIDFMWPERMTCGYNAYHFCGQLIETCQCSIEPVSRFLRPLLSITPDVLMLDPLVAFCGGGNMNDNTVMSQVIRQLKRLAAKFDCAVLVSITPERAATTVMPRRSAEPLPPSTWLGARSCQCR